MEQIFRHLCCPHDLIRLYLVIHQAHFALLVRLTDFLQLTKFRLAISVVFSSLAGYLLAADKIETQVLLGLFFGGFLWLVPPMLLTN